MWLCIDQGGHSSRAVVFDRNGEVAAQGSSALDTRRLECAFVEHEPQQLLGSVTAALGQVAAELGADCSRVRAAGLATQRSTLVCALRSTGEPLSPVISWQDRRGGSDLEQFQAHHDRIKTITGLRISPHYGVGKARWCMRHLESVRAASARQALIVAPLVSYLLYHLADRQHWRVDSPNASRTLRMDSRSLDWSPELLELFQVPRSVLPHIESCRFPYGHVELGGHEVPLVVSTGDQSAALYCTGEPSAGTAFVNAGTGAFIQAAVGDRPLLDEGLLTSIVWQADGRRLYALEGTVNGAGSALDVVAEELDYAPPRFDRELRSVLEDMSTAPLFLNGLSGLGSPYWVADFPSQFLGEGTPEQKFAAVYESIAFLIVRNLERMRKRLRLQRIVMTGGLAQVDWLVEEIASLSGLPVFQPRDTEATLRGLAFLVSAGALDMRLGGGARTVEPRPGSTARRRYAHWRQAMGALADGSRGRTSSSARTNI